MSEKKLNPEEVLEQAIASAKSDELADDELKASADRVWAKLTHESSTGRTGVEEIRNCVDFQALIPAYREGSLSEARRMLLEEHCRECVSCRKALQGRPEKVVAIEESRLSMMTNPWIKWGSLAASLLLAVLLADLLVFNGSMFYGRQAAVVASAQSGSLLSVGDRQVLPVMVGDAVENGQIIRTSRNSGAQLTLDDGSKVELAERTELSIQEGWRGTVVRLNRGNVIVEAAKQGARHLFVATGDCEVAVKGTVFSVRHGMKGSRVAVLEGEVWVEQKGENTVLKPGEQFSSSPKLAAASLENEFAWSLNAEEHLAVIRHLRELGKNFQQATFGDHLRYSSDLAGYLPAGTVVYGAAPNIAGQLHDFYGEFLAKVQENPDMKAWFDSNITPEDLPKLDELVNSMSDLGRELGDEVVIGLAPYAAGDPTTMRPVVLAEVVGSAASVREKVDAQITKIQENAAEGEPVPIFLVSSAAGPAPAKEGAFILVNDSILAASPSYEMLQLVETGGTGNASFVGSPFFETVAARYSQGVDWFLSADLAAMAGMHSETEPAEEPNDGFEPLGIGRIENVVVERKMVEGVPQNTAELNFAPLDSGILSWVANPGAMGGLDYVSQDAHMVSAFVVNDPAGLLTEFLASLERKDPEALAELRKVEAEHSFNLVDNFAAPLGGEVVFALDGPVLPTPSWKLIVEVKDPATFQNTIAWAVAEANRMAAAEGASDFVLELGVTDMGGEAQYSLKAGAEGTTLYYRYVRGFMIVAPDPALIEQAIGYSESAYSITTAPDFVALLPHDDNVNISGFVYHDFGRLMEPIVNSSLAQSVTESGSGAGEVLQEFLGGIPPLMVSVKCTSGQLAVSSSGDLETLWFNMMALSKLGGPEGVVSSMTTAIQ